MAFLDESNPKILIQPARVEERWVWASRQTRSLQLKRLEFAISDTGGETAHGGTYEVDDWKLVRYGPTLGYNDPNGIWFEEYEKKGSWA